jgi:hypothetical protein
MTKETLPLNLHINLPKPCHFDHHKNLIPHYNNNQLMEICKFNTNPNPNPIHSSNSPSPNINLSPNSNPYPKLLCMLTSSRVRDIFRVRLKVAVRDGVRELERKICKFHFRAPKNAPTR